MMTKMDLRTNQPYVKVRIECRMTQGGKNRLLGGVNFSFNNNEISFRRMVREFCHAIGIPMSTEMQEEVAKAERRLEAIVPEKRVMNQLRLKLGYGEDE